jgi:hypothetical protein
MVDKRKAAAVGALVAAGAAAGYFMLRKIPAAAAMPEIVDNVLSGPSTAVVGEIVTFSGKVVFKSALPSEVKFKVDLYVNGVKVGGESFTAAAGSTEAAYSLTFTFKEPGTYTVYTEAYW